MKITTITLVFSAVSLFMIIYSFSRFKRETLGIRATLLWVFLWFGIGFFSLFPSILDWAMALAQMEVRLFFISIVGMFILFALIFNMASRLDKLERFLGKTIQELSLLNQKLKNLEKNDRRSQD